MNADFWHNIWQNNHIGFHEKQPNQLLLKHFHTLNLESGDRVFLPLCGKTLDLAWLLSQGVKVVGVELSQLAIEQLFEALEITPDVTEIQGNKGVLLRYSAENIDVFVGDIFDLNNQIIGPVDAIYDRAALVALPADLRPVYTQHLQTLTAYAKQLLIVFEYMQDEMSGPPFAISSEMVHRYYQNKYQIQLLERQSVKGGLKGRCAANEVIWQLS